MYIKRLSKLTTRIICTSLAAFMVCIFTPLSVNPTAFVCEAATPEEYAAVFNADYYALHNPDVVAVLGDNPEVLLDHFLTYGMTEGRQANSEFNVFIYKNNYSDLRAAFGDDYTKYFMHYIECGKAEGRVAKIQGKSNGVLNNQVKLVNNINSYTSTQSSPAANDNLASASTFDEFKSIYFGKSVFIGDSVMTGFRNYSEYYTTASTHSSKFLANVGFSLYNASSAITASSKHPTYQGNKAYVWDNVAKMDVNRAFIMFGANELVSFSPDKAVTDYYIPFIQKIIAAKPGIEINVVSMPPVYAGTNKGHLSRQGVDTYNTLLSQMCANNGWHYVDITSYLKDSNGDLIPAYSSDKYVHINMKGYEQGWEPAIQNYALGVYNNLKK